MMKSIQTIIEQNCIIGSEADQEILSLFREYYHGESDIADLFISRGRIANILKTRQIIKHFLDERHSPKFTNYERTRLIDAMKKPTLSPVRKDIIFQNTFLTTANRFWHCSNAIQSFKESLGNKGGIWAKDMKGKIFYIKSDKHEKTTLNINEQLYGDLCDWHFCYCLRAENQIKTKNGRTVTHLPYDANFKNNNERDITRSPKHSQKLEELINYARGICPFHDSIEESTTPHTVQEVAS